MIRNSRIKLIGGLALLVGLIFLGYRLLIALHLTKLPPDAAGQTGNPESAIGEAAPSLSVYKTDPRWVWWNKQNARDPSYEWKMPIEFYGKVVDQDNKPVEGVKVVFQWTDTSPKGTSERTVYSASDGSFELAGVHGKRLGLTQIYKEGYYLVSNNMPHSFEYAAFFEENYHQPDAKTPVVFGLRKMGEVPQELTARRTLMGIKPSGEPHYVDLQTTRKTGAGQGDIAISITRTASADVKQYDWSASIKGVNGAGLLESTEEFMFEAPKAGY